MLSRPTVTMDKNMKSPPVFIRCVSLGNSLPSNITGEDERETQQRKCRTSVLHIRYETERGTCIAAYQKRAIFGQSSDLQGDKL